MNCTLLGCAVATLFSCAAGASSQRVYEVSTAPIAGGDRAEGARSGFSGTDFEDLALGNIEGQGPADDPWRIFQTQSTGLGAHVVDLALKSRVLRLFKNTVIPGGANTGAFSPTFKNPDAGVFRVDVKIDDHEGADYDVVGQAPNQNFITFRVKFQWMGNIFVLDQIGTNLQFIDTGVAWRQGAWANLTIAYDADADTMDYFYDGAHLYSSVGGMFAGSRVEEAVLLSDNFQHLSFGSFTGGPVSGYMDNVRLVPTPGGAAMLAVCGASCARRRRT